MSVARMTRNMALLPWMTPERWPPSGGSSPVSSTNVHRNPITSNLILEFVCRVFTDAAHGPARNLRAAFVDARGDQGVHGRQVGAVEVLQRVAAVVKEVQQACWRRRGTRRMLCGSPPSRACGKLGRHDSTLPRKLAAGYPHRVCTFRRRLQLNEAGVPPPGRCAARAQLALPAEAIVIRHAFYRVWI
jgi:hypothetical protein